MDIQKIVVYMLPLSGGDGSVCHSWHLTEESADARVQKEVDEGEAFGDLEPIPVDTWTGSRQHLDAVVTDGVSSIRVRHTGGETTLRVVVDSDEEDGAVELLLGSASSSPVLFRHRLRKHGITGRVSVIWLVPNGDAEIEIPIEVCW